ncbi:MULTISPECIES: dienelactone hydrolase family protein [unclassified Crossiella]|uniref:dienelactone hydrolase family protein n=1 Tax=unclassified Crossiella TaxID=2620835 RepID=UPI001FFE6080|nr:MULTISPECIES: dienelactone hydrolase family protein [unclassified Crossiella]MCK2244794.1 dienelactone hydrolase family protein [Crossiella sp. S99.2]MCK2258436.1 dienelactone hydrolase family protein [Crossiella sp. S99.1]
MAEIVLFHHTRGLTEGIRRFAEGFRAAGHTVHTPDLFDGILPESIEAGLALIRELGDELDRRADRAVGDLPAALVYGGFSAGESVAQRLAQTRPGAVGALLYESCIPITGEWAFGSWPAGLPVQIHGAEGDEFFGEDLPAARALVEIAGPELAELFLYPASAHLFTDSSLPGYDAEAAALVLQRSTAFLARLG